MEQFKKDDEHCESSSSDEDDASDSSCGPLYHLQDLITQLPIKRGLSKFYNGKSQSFASLSNLKSNEDLGKSCGVRRRKRMKPCKSYKVGPKATITKTTPKIVYYSPSFGTKNVNALAINI